MGGFFCFGHVQSSCRGSTTQRLKVTFVNSRHLLLKTESFYIASCSIVYLNSNYDAITNLCVGLKSIPLICWEINVSVIWGCV